MCNLPCRRYACEQKEIFEAWDEAKKSICKAGIANLMLWLQDHEWCFQGAAWRQAISWNPSEQLCKIVSDPSLKLRSFTLTADSLSICISKEVQTIECTSIEGIDRNLRNLTVGNESNVVQYDLSKATDIAENTRSIVRSFKRNDVRIRRKLYRKYGLRRKRRVNQLLNRLTKAIVQQVKQKTSAIAFEDIRHIRKMYQKGNYQGCSFRARLNGWSFAEVKRQIEYKAAWEGILLSNYQSKKQEAHLSSVHDAGRR